MRQTRCFECDRVKNASELLLVMSVIALLAVISYFMPTAPVWVALLALAAIPIGGAAVLLLATQRYEICEGRLYVCTRWNKKLLEAVQSGAIVQVVNWGSRRLIEIQTRDNTTLLDCVKESEEFEREVRNICGPDEIMQVPRCEVCRSTPLSRVASLVTAAFSAFIPLSVLLIFGLHLLVLLAVSPYLLLSACFGLSAFLNKRNTRIERDGTVIKVYNLFGHKSAEFEIEEGVKFRKTATMRHQLSTDGRKDYLPSHFSFCKAFQFHLYAIASGEYEFVGEA